MSAFEINCIVIAAAVVLMIVLGLALDPVQREKRAARRAEKEKRIAAAHAERERQRQERQRAERKAKRTAALQASLLFAVWTWFTIHPITRAVLIMLVVAGSWYLVDGRYVYRQNSSTIYRIDSITGHVCHFNSGWLCG
jgi:Flp pilus assembly protein TadB